MFCNGCKCDCEVRDFLNNQDKCYKCIYNEKTKKVVKKTPNCKICGNKIITLPHKKMNQRHTYCSQECADEGHRMQNNKYWTKSLRESQPLLKA